MSAFHSSEQEALSSSSSCLILCGNHFGGMHVMGSGTCLYALCRQIIHPTLCLGYRFHSYCLLFIFPTIRTCTHILTMKETSAPMFSISFLFFAVPSYQGKESHALGSARSVRRGHFQRTSVIEATRQRRRRDSRTHICTHIHTNIDMHACMCALQKGESVV